MLDNNEHICQGVGDLATFNVNSKCFYFRLKDSRPIDLHFEEFNKLVMS